MMKGEGGPSKVQFKGAVVDSLYPTELVEAFLFKNLLYIRPITSSITSRGGWENSLKPSQNIYKAN